MSVNCTFPNPCIAASKVRLPEIACKRKFVGAAEHCRSSMISGLLTVIQQFIPSDGGVITPHLHMHLPLMTSQPLPNVLADSRTQDRVHSDTSVLCTNGW